MDPLLDRFRDAMAEVPAGIAVVVARDEAGRPVGATVSSMTSLSIDPPLVIICLAETSDTRHSLDVGHRFTMQLLRDGQQDVARTMARKGIGKFDGIPLRENADGSLEMEGCAVTMHCTVDAIVPGGDHVIVVGEVRDARVHGGDPLLYHRRAIAPIQTAS